MVTLFQCLESEFDDTSENTLADYIQPSVVASRNGIDLSIVMNFIRDRHIEMIDKRMPPEAVSRFEVALHVVCQKYCERSEALKMVDSANHLDDMVDMGHIRHQVFYGLDFYRRADLEQQFQEDVSAPKAPVEMPAPEAGKARTMVTRPTVINAEVIKPNKPPTVLMVEGQEYVVTEEASRILGVVKETFRRQLSGQIQSYDLHWQHRARYYLKTDIEKLKNRPKYCLSTKIIEGEVYITVAGSAEILHEKMPAVWLWLGSGQLRLNDKPIEIKQINGRSWIRKADIQAVAEQDFFRLGHIGYIEFGQKIAVDPSKPVSRQSVRNWVLLGKLIGVVGPGGTNYVRGDQLEQGKLLAQAAQKFVFR